MKYVLTIVSRDVLTAEEGVGTTGMRKGGKSTQGEKYGNDINVQ